MKPLTIEQLKALEVGDWVWMTTADKKYGSYGRVCEKFDECNFRVETIESYIVDPYETYGTKWLAYKNKEQAEAKGEIVELPCLIEIPCKIPCIDKTVRHKNYMLLYINQDDILETKTFAECDKAEAERRLAELKGEKHHETLLRNLL